MVPGHRVESRSVLLFERRGFDMPALMAAGKTQYIEAATASGESIL
jgi:hypothetical protein